MIEIVKSYLITDSEWGFALVVEDKEGNKYKQIKYTGFDGLLSDITYKKYE